MLTAPSGARFIRHVKEAERPIFAWTVNEENLMKWCIQKQLDGVITDDPKLFNQVVCNWDDQEPTAHLSLYQTLYLLWLYCLIIFFTRPFRKRFPEKVEQYINREELKSKVALKLGA